MEATLGFDWEAILPIAMFALFGAFFVAIIMLGLRQQRRVRENLQKLGGRLGLPLVEPQKKGFLNSKLPRVTGSWRGRNTSIYAYTTGSGKNRQHWCAIGVAVQNPGKLTLRISAENLFTRAGRAFGIDDVATSDPEFDQKFYVKSNDPAYIKVALLPEVRRTFLDLWKNGARGSFRLEDEALVYAESGWFSNQRLCDRFPALTELTANLAEIVEARRG